MAAIAAIRKYCRHSNPVCYIGEHWKNDRRGEPADLRCSIERDAGWTMADKARVPDLEAVNFRETPFILIFQLSKLWFMSKEVGCTCEVKHAILTESGDDVFPMDVS